MGADIDTTRPFLPGIVAASPVVDDRVVRTLAGDLGVETIDAILGAFVKDSESLTQALEQAIQGGDTRAIDHSAHALKGAALNLGFHRMATCCNLFRDLCRTDRVDEVRALAPQLQTILADTCRAVGRLREELAN